MTCVLLSTWTNGLFVFQGGSVREEWPGRSVRGLSHDGGDGVLAIVDGTLLCRRAADGTWRTLARSEVELACAIALGEEIYVGVSHTPDVMRLARGRLERLAGFDAVAGRDKWYAGAALIDGRLLGPPLGIRSLAASCDGTTLLANVHVGGIPRSTDGGSTWHPTIDIDSDVHQVCTHPRRPELAIAATAMGLAVSRDGGASWAIEREGLHACYCSAVAFIGDDLLVAASTDHFARQGAVYRRRIDAHTPLVPVAGLPQWLNGIADTGNVAVRAATLAVADKYGTLYQSEDAGQHWSQAAQGLPTPSSVAVC